MFRVHLSCSHRFAWPPMRLQTFLSLAFPAVHGRGSVLVGRGNAATSRPVIIRADAAGSAVDSTAETAWGICPMKIESVVFGARLRKDRDQIETIVWTYLAPAQGAVLIGQVGAEACPTTDP